MCIIHENTRYLCEILMKILFSQKIFEKISDVKLHENPYSGNRIIPCGRADGRTEKRTEMTR